jgi:isopenicillin-N N-acyltransferase like protein
MYSAELTGRPRQRGQAYGEALRQPIRDHIEYFWDGISKGSGQDPSAFIHQWLTETNFLPAIECWTPSLFEEVKGIGEGAGLDFETIYSWQLLDELGWYINYIFLPRIQKNPAKNEHESFQCSSFGVSSRAGKPAILAQNWDSHILLDGSQALLHISDPNEDLELYSVAAVGRIGPFGLSRHGIGLCMNSLNEYVNFSANGLPVVFLSRGVLEQPDYQSAVSFLQRAPHATGQAYAIGGQSEVAVYECSANQVYQYLPENKHGWIVHTNHPLVNSDLRIPKDELENQTSSFKAGRREKEANSVTRFTSISNRLFEVTPTNSVETAQQILRSHDSPTYPVCRHPRRDSIITTMFGMIMELTDPPILYVAPCRPCETEFKPLYFQGYP